jgi:hypothetical protein
MGPIRAIFGGVGVFVFISLKTEAIFSSEMSVDFQRRYVPEDSTLLINYVCVAPTEDEH